MHQELWVPVHYQSLDGSRTTLRVDSVIVTAGTSVCGLSGVYALVNGGSVCVCVFVCLCVFVHVCVMHVMSL